MAMLLMSNGLQGDQHGGDQRDEWDEWGQTLIIKDWLFRFCSG
jgi:hypothetical protein